MTKVLITPATLHLSSAAYLDVLRGAGLVPAFAAPGATASAEGLRRELDGAVGVIAGSEPYTPAVLAAAPALRVIARVGVGYDAIDVAAATARGIAVTIAPGTNHDAVAEHAFALILGLAKRLMRHHPDVCRGGWPHETTVPLRGRVLGIAGLGRIGKGVAVRGAAFGMRLLAFDEVPDAAFARTQNIALVSWERLLGESDFLTLHLPLSPSSRHLINRATLARMKPTAFLINTARGGLVCEADLVEALNAGRIAGAGLDVFETEPPAAHRALLELDNVLLTPHTAGLDEQSREEMALAAARSVVAIHRGEWPAGQAVNPDAWPADRRAARP